MGKCNYRHSVVTVVILFSVFGAFAGDETPTNARLQFRPIARARNNLTTSQVWNIY